MSGQKNAEPCRIVIPVYRRLSPPQLKIVRHNIEMLKPYPVTLIGSTAQQALLRETAERLSDLDGHAVGIELFDARFFQDIEGYNHLMTGRDFYDRFAGSRYVLICQDDALILRDSLKEWLTGEYAFVGAPMFEGFCAPTQPRRFLSTLNGGLSLRDVAAALAVFDGSIMVRKSRVVSLAEKTGLVNVCNWLLKCCSGRQIVIRRSGLNEDVFWTGIVAERFEQFRIPDPEIAARFAFEVCPDELYEMAGQSLPFGCHAFLRYDMQFWLRHVADDLIPILKELSAE